MAAANHEQRLADSPRRHKPPAAWDFQWAVTGFDEFRVA
jgi:hypothetical protein